LLEPRFARSTFFGRPSGIIAFLWKGFFVDGKLWLELCYTLLGAAMSFTAAAWRPSQLASCS